MHYSIKYAAALLGAVSAFFLVPLLIAAQGGSGESAARPLPPDASPRDQQVFRYMSPEPRTLDSAINDYDTEDTIIPFEPLLRRDPNWNPEPAAADSYTSSPDGKTWTFHLRQGARWSDGRPVTAHDFVYSFR
ncbi:MAG: ABC transporter substrate-binding protein, partial [Gemmatimonadota bacterium]|nr:ABC transporter substrate-binding protein [Gemmatimonadota bacterium]